jgi:hypothetical protein
MHCNSNIKITHAVVPSNQIYFRAGARKQPLNVPRGYTFDQFTQFFYRRFIASIFLGSILHF